MADINSKEGGGGGAGGGGRYAYEMLKNAKNQKCTTSLGNVGHGQSINNEQTQWANDASEVVLRSNGEWLCFKHINQQTNIHYTSWWIHHPSKEKNN